MQKIITIKNGVARQEQYRFREPLNIEIADGEPIAIIGENGSGKSLLVDILTGKYPLTNDYPLYDFSPSSSTRASDNIRKIAFCDTYGDSSSMSYYQQRWNQGVEYGEAAPTVRSLLNAGTADSAWLNEIYSVLGIADMLDKFVYMLSSGELRRFQLAQSLSYMPRVLVVDNPFIGLDAAVRIQVSEILHHICKLKNVLLILVVSSYRDIPSYINKVVVLDKMYLKGMEDANEYRMECSRQADARFLSDTLRRSLLEKEYTMPVSVSEKVVQCNNVSIAYDKRVILKNLDWTVLQGEKWALCGENGAGKSTLLSLVCADNPQSYACDISLFGNKRGSGESIWDIKKRIGFVSPEMYRAYKKNIPSIDIVASGLYDSIGLYHRPTDEERACCKWWMGVFGIAHLSGRSYLTLSSGEQRMVLLARAFVKDPELLILDEPFHGLDNNNKDLARDIIETYCSRPHKTLIMVSHYEEEFPQCINRKLTLRKNV